MKSNGMDCSIDQCSIAISVTRIIVNAGGIIVYFLLKSKRSIFIKCGLEQERGKMNFKNSNDSKKETIEKRDVYSICRRYQISG